MGRSALEEARRAVAEQDTTGVPCQGTVDRRLDASITPIRSDPSAPQIVTVGTATERAEMWWALIALGDLVTINPRSSGPQPGPY